MSAVIVEGDTTTFQLEATRDGDAWDISGATVSLRLRSPDGTDSGALSATVTDGPAGEAQYTADGDTLDAPGDWARQWTVTKSGVTLSSARIEFRVLPLLPDMS